MNTKVRRIGDRGLFLRKGLWWVDIRVNGQRIRECAGADKKQAAAYIAALRTWGRSERHGGDDKRPQGPAAKAMTFKEMTAEYIALYGSRKRSAERDERSIAHLVRLLGDTTPLSAIDQLAAERYRAARKVEGVKAATTNRELACLRSILFRAVECGRLSLYPLKRRGLLEREAAFKPHIFTAEEIVLMLKHAEPRWTRPAIAVLYRTGLRKNELLKLRRTDVDFGRRLLTVRAENSKSGKARTIPIDDETAATLAAMTGKEYFFETKPGHHKRDLLFGFHKAVEAAGIKGRVRIHDLRDSYGTDLHRAGVPAKVAAALLGHTVAVYLSRYVHTDSEDMAAAIVRLAAARENGQKVQTTPVAVPVSEGESAVSN